MPEVVDRGFEKELEGCTHVDFNDLAKHFTVDYYLAMYDRMMPLFLQVDDYPGQYIYNPSEAEKCAIHYGLRQVIEDLWEFSKPAVVDFLDSDKRFKFREGLWLIDDDFYENAFHHNLDAANSIVTKLFSEVYDAWTHDTQARWNDAGHHEDPIPLLYWLFRMHSIMKNGGDREDGLERTFTSGIKYKFECLGTHPDLSRETVEQATENSLSGDMKGSSVHGVVSSSTIDVIIEHRKAGGLAYLFDSDTPRIYLNPELEPKIAERVAERQPRYSDQTNLVLQCPAKFAAAKVYEQGTMLHDIMRFKHGVYVEAYLATHCRN